MTTGLKHRAARLLCLWHGHVPDLGVVYSVACGKHVPCICCSRCHKVLG